MNREILFRGKSGDGWHYGLLTKYGNHKWRVVEEDNNMVTVKTDTIGQYTGLTDTNDTKIFEGDILQVNYHGDEIGRVCIYYKYAMYLCNTIYGDIDYDTLGMLNANYQLEVIGNVYDNPEMVSQDTH